MEGIRSLRSLRTITNESRLALIHLRLPPVTLPCRLKRINGNGEVMAKWPLAWGVHGVLMRKCIHLKPIVISCFSLSLFLTLTLSLSHSLSALCSLFTIHSSSKFQRHLTPSPSFVASAHSSTSFRPSTSIHHQRSTSEYTNIQHSSFLNPHTSCKQHFCRKHIIPISTSNTSNTSNTPPPSTNLSRFVHKVIQDGCRGIMCKLRLELPSGNFPLVSSWRQE